MDNSEIKKMMKIRKLQKRKHSGIRYSYLSENRDKNGLKKIVRIPSHIPCDQNSRYKFLREKKEN